MMQNEHPQLWAGPCYCRQVETCTVVREQDIQLAEGCAGRQQLVQPLLEWVVVAQPVAYRQHLQRGWQRRHFRKAALLCVQQAQPSAASGAPSCLTDAGGGAALPLISVCIHWSLFFPLQRRQVGQCGRDVHQKAAGILRVVIVHFFMCNGNAQGAELLALADGIL